MKQAVDIATEIIDELTGRSGFDGFWDSVDDETRDEILTKLTSIIAEGQQGRSPADREAHNLEVGGSIPPPATSPQAPIAKVTVRESLAGHYAPDDVSVKLYAPGLPPGDHDLYCEPEAVAPYLRAVQPNGDV